MTNLLRLLTPTQVQTLYLDWANNFISSEAFAEHYGLDIDHAQAIIHTGREINNAMHRPNAELLAKEVNDNA